MDIALEFYRAEQAEKPDIPLDGPTDYLVRTPSGGVENYTLDWAEWQERIAALDVRTTSPGALREIGTRLREALRGLRLSAAEADIVAASRREQPVIITIKSAAAEIARLPWELWVVKPTGQHLAELENVLLRYALPSAPAFARATAPEQPGRVVVAYAGDVAAAEHIAAVEEASHGLSFERDRDVIARLSPRRLREALDRAQEQNAPISVLHLLCHGTLQPDRTCALVWAGDSDDGREVMVDGADLARILGNHAEQVRLVVLSACHSANAGTLGNLLGSVAQELHRHGIETVIASRLALSMDGSVVFARHFYRALVAERTSVEQAFLAARRELALDHQGLDWARLQFFAQPRGDATTGTWPLGEPPRDGQVSARSEDAPGPAAPARPPARPSARAGADIEDRDGATPAPTFDALMARHQRVEGGRR
ncbi:MAG: CHAT domain-containing protein, partial [Myxococcota bacterium]